MKSSNEQKLLNFLDKGHNYLKKNHKAIKYRSLLLLLVVFSVNTFAWFIYLSQGDVSVSANVSKWSINFFTDSVISKDIEIIIDKAKPGMDPFEKIIKVANNSDMDANFSYDILSTTILGKEIINKDDALVNKENILKNNYPYKLSFTHNSNIIKIDQTLDFKFNMNWPYEEANKYFKLTSVYKYDPSINYYYYTNNNYVKATDITKDNFSSKYQTLYIEKDDADSFFGNQCNIYKTEKKEPCIKIKTRLSAEQIVEKK